MATSANPDALLRRTARDASATLKVFVGASPGVGKTYKMLEAAREARRQGVDIVIGVIESHGRQDTEALCDGLERIPLLPVDHRGTRFHELDLDRILQRAPAVVLVDELAHRNIPGTRHPRRYQDIQELLAHGIDVWTTINIQHLESLNDVVARITGVRMRETVPDSLLSEAREVVLVDITPAELIDRLKQGKVYVPEQARAAIDGFFSPANLAALRELTLQVVADRVDQDVLDIMRAQGLSGPWPVRARIVVAIDGLGNGNEVVRLSRRLAERRRAQWSVVFVDRGNTSSEQETKVQQTFQLAERLGATTVRLRGYDPVVELLAFAREQNATTLVLGRTRHRQFAGLIGQTVSQRLLRQSADLEITFVPTRVSRVARQPRRSRPATSAFYYALSLVSVAVATLAAAFIEPVVPLGSLSLIYMTAVLLVAVNTETRPAMVTALLSATSYNFFFTDPRYTLYVDRAPELITVGLFFIVGLIGGQLAARLRTQILALRATNAQTTTLLSLSRRLTDAVDRVTVYREATTAISDYLRIPVVLLAPDNGGNLCQVAASDDAVELDHKAQSAAVWAYDHRQATGFQTETLSGIPWRFIPLVLEQQSLAVIGVQRPPAGLRSDQLAFTDALATQVSFSLARIGLSTSLERARVAEETERLRSTLLSSVSHDLRTPLASMIGSASSLRSLGESLSAEDRHELLDAVVSEGERLNRYIQNLLDMTRLGHGSLQLERTWIGIDDIINSTLARTRDLIREKRLVRSVEPDLPLLYVHPALIEQALVNVIENAAKFSPKGGEIRVSAARDNEELRIEVSDEGPGIPSEQRERVFNMFFTGGEGDGSKYGSGLGLAICSGMIGAHGGRIEALPGPTGRGTTIRITLPFPETPADDDEDDA